MRRPVGTIGLDLSLRSTGACFIPRGWEGDMREGKGLVVGGPWGREIDAVLSCTTVGAERDKAQRMSEVVAEVHRFVERFDHGRQVYVESYAFGLASRAHASLLMELGGAVKVHLLRELGVTCIPVAAPSARKTMFDNCPVKGAKEFVERNVRRLKGEALYWNGDQIDAAVVCNHGVRLRGWTPISFEGKSIEELDAEERASARTSSTRKRASARR